MIVIASFLGSGNTLLRNILYEVYGIESSTYLINPNQIQDENFSKYPLWRCICSTWAPTVTKKAAYIYIIRDGRDALCSIAIIEKIVLN
jgi:hypothetical protein